MKSFKDLLRTMILYYNITISSKDFDFTLTKMQHGLHMLLSYCKHAAWLQHDIPDIDLDYIDP